MIDQASVFAERFKGNPQVLQATVLGQGNIPGLDPYTALNALRLIKESNAMAMAGKAQQPTSSPSILAETLAPPAPPQGLAGMMPMGAVAGQVPSRAPAPAPQAPVMQASGGLAGMYTPDEDYAEGGIVAFDDGGLTLPPGTPYDENETGTYAEDSEGGTGNASAQGDFNAYLMKRLRAMEGFSPKEMSEEDQDRLFKKFYEREEKMAGPDIYAPEIARGKEDEADRARSRRVGEANALLTAAGKVLKGHTLAMGASEALPAYGSAMNEVERADQAAKSANAKMQFALKDAQRKERMGNVRAATASMENVRKFQQDANKALFDKEKALADLAAKGAVANRPRAGAGGSKLAERLADAEEAFALNPTAENKARLNALTSAASKMKTTFSTSESGPIKAGTALAPVQERIDAQVSAALTKFKQTDQAGAAYRRAVRAKDMDEANRLLKAEEDRLRGVFQKSEAAASGGKGTQTPGVIKLD